VVVEIEVMRGEGAIAVAVDKQEDALDEVQRVGGEVYA